MSRRGGMAQRSRKEWGARGVLAAIAAVVGYVCVTHALAQAVARNDPAFAYRLAPNDGRITGRLALSLSGADASTLARRRADALSRKALLKDATAVSAIAALGVNAEIRGERAKARRLFGYSQMLSRRDLQTQLWAIEEAVTRGDVAGALRHYDIALRTDANSWDLLFSVLASATADPSVRVALVKTLASKPIWGESFIPYLATHAPDPRSSAALFLGLQRAGMVVPDKARAPTVNGLIADGFVDEAWRYYTSVAPNTDRRSSRDPRFAIDTDTPSLLDWVPINDGSVTTSIQRGATGGIFDFAAPASVGGLLLQQLQLLPPGAYRIAGHSSGIEQEDRALPYWVLSCRQDGRELGRVPLPNSAEAGGHFAGSFVVPANCPVQMLMLVARPSDAVAGLSGQIDRVQLAPLQ